MIFHLNQDCQLVDEPEVNLGDGMDFFIRNAAAQRFCDHPDTAVIYHMQLFQKCVMIQLAEVVGEQAVYVLLQGADGFHECALEVGADTHNLTGCLHLGSQGTFCADEFIERKSRHFYDTVV